MLVYVLKSSVLRLVVSVFSAVTQAIHWQKYISDGYPTSDMEVRLNCTEGHGYA